MVRMVVDVDLTKTSKLLVDCRLINAGVLYLAGTASVALAIESFAAGSIIEAVVAGILSIVVHSAWRQSGLIDPREWASHKRALWLLLATSGLMIAMLRVSEPERTPGGLLTYALALASWLKLFAAGVLGLWFLRGLRTSLPTAVVGLLTQLRERRSRSPRPQSWRASSIRTFLFVGFGIGVLAVSRLASAWVPWCFPGEPLEQVGEVSVRISPLLDLVGCLLLIRARKTFQVPADTVATNDTRAPILLLRSFSDDAAAHYLAFSVYALFDYSLETRLARHFANYGPFVAVGSPKDKVPVLGAARAYLPDDQWQLQVKRWMQDSQLLVFSFGTSKWIAWELRQAIELRVTHKMVLMLPRARTLREKLRWRFHAREDRERLLDALRASFQGTAWENAFRVVAAPEHVCAFVLQEDGGLTTVRSRAQGTRDAYHLSVLVAHGIISSALPSESALALAPSDRGHRAPAGTG